MAGPLADVIADVERLPRGIVERAAERFDEIAVESASVAVGSGGVMNIRGPRGPRPTRLGTRPQFSKGKAVVSAVVRGKPLGPWIWIEDGTKAHDIAPKRSIGRGRNKRLKALGRPGQGDMLHPVYGKVHHKGTTGKKAWTRAAADMEFEIDGLIDAEVREVLRG